MWRLILKTKSDPVFRLEKKSHVLLTDPQSNETITFVYYKSVYIYIYFPIKNNL